MMYFSCAALEEAKKMITLFTTTKVQSAGLLEVLVDSRFCFSVRQCRFLWRSRLDMERTIVCEEGPLV
eukprot:6229845-Amphidinium_carterae.2